MKTETAKRGITFTSATEISKNAREKLDKLSEIKKEKLEKIVKDFNEGRLIIGSSQ